MACGRAQLASQADIASRGSSAKASGKSSHEAAVQRLLGWIAAGGSAAAFCAIVWACVCETIKQAHNITNRKKDNNMTLILLESLLALLILVGIVWWTMKPDKKEPND
jgi:hypothetical protein